MNDSAPKEVQLAEALGTALLALDVIAEAAHSDARLTAQLTLTYIKDHYGFVPEVP
jgi:hypothetical protein